MSPGSVKISRPSRMHRQRGVGLVRLDRLAPVTLHQPDDRVGVQQVDALGAQLPAPRAAGRLVQSLRQDEAELGQQPRPGVLNAVDEDALPRRRDQAGLPGELGMGRGRVGDLLLGRSRPVRPSWPTDRGPGRPWSPGPPTARPNPGGPSTGPRSAPVRPACRSRTSSCPDRRARIRSGCSAAIFSNWIPSVSVSTVGAGALPSAASAQGPMMPPAPSSNHLVEPTGTTPTARQSSCSLSPTVTTRRGSAVIVVSPNLCAMVTGNAPASAPPAPDRPAPPSRPKRCSPARPVGAGRDRKRSQQKPATGKAH